MDLKEWNKMIASEIKSLGEQLQEQDKKVTSAIGELYHMMITRTWLAITLSGVALALSVTALIISLN